MNNGQEPSSCLTGRMKTLNDNALKALLRAEYSASSIVLLSLISVYILGFQMIAHPMTSIMILY
jgi:hypothetical protein